MVEYRLVEGQECHSCGYFDIPLVSSEVRDIDSRCHGERLWLCEVCANTQLSDHAVYPNTYGKHRQLFSSIGWIANKILEEIRSNCKADKKEPD